MLSPVINLLDEAVVPSTRDRLGSGRLLDSCVKFTERKSNPSVMVDKRNTGFTKDMK